MALEDDEHVQLTEIVGGNVDGNENVVSKIIQKDKFKLSILICMFTISLFAIVLLICIPVIYVRPLDSRFPPIVFPVSSSQLGVYNSAVVACDNGYCSTIGNDMLLKGGSAIDAAIAALLCNSVVNMHNLGIGGGFVSVLWSNGSIWTTDAYGLANQNATESLFSSNPDVLDLGRLSILVPGELAGYKNLHSQFGKLPFRDLVLPSIDLCTRGFAIGPALVEGINFVAKKANLEKHPEMKVLVDFLTNPKTGSWYNAGDILRCPELANSLQLIADNGPEDFYEGKLSALILEDFEEMSIPINKKDLVTYRPENGRKPVVLNLPGNISLWTSKPSSSGAAAAFAMNILSGYNWTASSSQDPLNYHRYVEALKFAWGQWSYFGDVAFMNETELDERLKNITSQRMGDLVRRKIDDSGVLPLEDYGTYGTPSVFRDENSHRSTSHLSAIDSSGMGISITSTINGHFGSFVMGRRTGIIFNNGMSNFFLNQSSNETLPLPPYNFIEPGKRPMTTISPMIFTKNDALHLIVGASGGNRIISTVPYVAIRTLWFNETVKQAVDALRLQHLLIPDVLNYEKEWPGWMLNYLSAKGHKIQKPFTSRRSSISQAIQRLPNGTFFAISDFRKEGSFTAGY